MVDKVGLEVPLRLLVNFQAGPSEKTLRMAIGSLFTFSLPTSHCLAPTQLGIVDSDLMSLSALGYFLPIFLEPSVIVNSAGLWKRLLPLDPLTPCSADFLPGYLNTTH